ncbi:hypothetical protein Acor_64630 [Acrocarpospora corrugata]|uniref:AB hydrolase-1 domain-containing protein n=1 Tax=Acrocarpospora corrugata TaxID=35763 RepID=A0A5M3W5V0_9ACTN|nr:hypothetical protein Acor_64630 [Acrocarpospora corrugata]
MHGAFTDKTHPTLYGVATALAPWFTVFNYDRRGRGESGDTQPYAIEREIEDLSALIEAAGGSAMVFRWVLRRRPGAGGHGPEPGHLATRCVGASVPR